MFIPRKADLVDLILTYICQIIIDSLNSELSRFCLLYVITNFGCTKNANWYLLAFKRWNKQTLDMYKWVSLYLQEKVKKNTRFGKGTGN